MEAGQAGLAGEEFLHGGLYEVALLGYDPVEPVQQCIDIAQCVRDSALFKGARQSDRNPDNVIPVKCWHGSRRVKSLQLELLQKHRNKPRVIALEVLHPKCRVM